jgi:hypothetical protein
MSPNRNSCRRICTSFLAAVLIVLPLTAHAKDADKSNRTSNELAAATTVSLWQNPTDIASRDLYYGPGGKEHAPHTIYTFVKEDMSGTNPKFEVRDEDGVKWKVKLGVEARPETVASRLVWAVGYYANEDYFLPTLHVEDMPRLRRGQNLVASDGTIQNVRLKRYLKGEKKIGTWKWRDNPFAREREVNGLRVVMALINNWDLKDENNAVYEEKEKDNDSPSLRYLVSDLGASFGTTGRSWTHGLSKGNLKSYRSSKFIRKVTPEYVDFATPSRPALIYVFTPKEYINRTDLRWIGHHVLRSDAKWIGGLLAQLSPEQIRDAFRAAGYTPEQVEGFSAVVQKRITELNNL